MQWQFRQIDIAGCAAFHVRLLVFGKVDFWFRHWLHRVADESMVYMSVVAVGVVCQQQIIFAADVENFSPGLLCIETY